MHLVGPEGTFYFRPFHRPCEEAIKEALKVPTVGNVEILEKLEDEAVLDSGLFGVCVTRKKDRVQCFQSLVLK